MENNPRSHDLYQYEGLAPGEIRLLTLDAGSGNEPLTGTLDICSLVTVRPFSAISYAWGSHTVEDSLDLRDTYFPITRSVASALRRFRNVDCTATVWIDQLCINQQDTREQGHQVAIMSRIYSQAEEVLAWLGESEPSDALAFWALHNLANNPQAVLPDVHTAVQARLVVNLVLFNKTNLVTDMKVCPCCDANAEADAEGQPVNLVDIINALEALMSRSYWTRLWPVQEIALGEVSIYYSGSHCIDFASMYRATEILAQAQVAAPFFSIRFGQLSLIESACRARVSALQTAIETTGFACSEPRDRIFAIRPLTSELDDTLLLPDYDIPLAELWRRVALCALQPKPYLRCSDAHDSVALALASNSVTVTSPPRPSWVPEVGGDFDQQWRKLMYYTQYSQAFHAGGGGEWTVGHNARYPEYIRLLGFNSSAIESILSGSQTEQVLGQSSPRNAENTMHGHIERHVVPWYLTCRRFLFGRANPLEIHPSQFGLLLRQGDEWVGDATPPFDDCEPVIEKALRICRRPEDPSLETRQVFADVRPLLSKDSHRRYTDVWWTLAILTDRRVAWVPNTARVGDDICLFQGAPLPFVLRKSDDGSYVNIGDAYVHGIMHGQAWPADGKGVGTIHLR